MGHILSTYEYSYMYNTHIDVINASCCACRYLKPLPTSLLQVPNFLCTVSWRKKTDHEMDFTGYV